MRSMVEGIEPRVAGRNDRLYGLVQVCRYIACCNTERRDAMGHQPGIPHQIELGPIAHFMRRAVNLDRQACFIAEEIENIATGGMLTAELETIGSTAEARP